MKKALINLNAIASGIYLIRGKKVMLDRDLAALYSTTTGALKQAVKRNLERFPPDSVFQLTPLENENWIPRITKSGCKKTGIYRMPLAFTGNGAAMLSSVLRSREAALVNIEIARAFTGSVK
ncbi:MAG: ORF6N domain-containing protein [Candidatus Omnitrophota bacterium]|jgi:hypothetical protein